MKTTMLVLVCAVASILVIYGSMDRNSPRNSAPPIGLKHPEAYPPGPAREAARKRLEEWRGEKIAEFEARMQSRRGQERQALLESPEHGPYLREVTKVTDADGTVQVARMPAWAQQRYDDEAQRAEALAKRWGPGKKFVEIVGERSMADQREILAAVQEVIVTSAFSPDGRRATPENKAKAIRGSLRPGIEITDDQILRLLRVDPPESLWSKAD